MARVVVAGIPHHVTQRGNRRQQTFFCDADYTEYKNLLARWCARCGVEIWGYCLMPNHVHLIAVPQASESLRSAMGEIHRRYTRRINFREGWRGHLWQGRFASVAMDGAHLLAAARYVERNPVRARMCTQPWDFRWSGAAAHVTGQDDGVVKTVPLLGMVPDWREFVAVESSDSELKAIRRHERTGRPLGSASFIHELEMLLSRPLFPQKPGPKKSVEGPGQTHLFEN